MNSAPPRRAVYFISVTQRHPRAVRRCRESRGDTAESSRRSRGREREGGEPRRGISAVLSSTGRMILASGDATRVASPRRVREITRSRERVEICDGEERSRDYASRAATFVTDRAINPERPDGSQGGKYLRDKIRRYYLGGFALASPHIAVPLALRSATPSRREGRRENRLNEREHVASASSECRSSTFLSSASPIIGTDRRRTPRRLEFKLHTGCSGLNDEEYLEIEYLARLNTYNIYTAYKRCPFVSPPCSRDRTFVSFCFPIRTDNQRRPDPRQRRPLLA